MRNRVLQVAAPALWIAAAGLWGCQRPAADMEAMRAPERPEALARLDRFVGTWVGESEVRIPGHDEVMTAQAKDVISWAADGWALVEDFSMQQGDDTVHGFGMWVWNARRGRYEVHGVDSTGGISERLRDDRRTVVPGSCRLRVSVRRDQPLEDGALLLSALPPSPVVVCMLSRSAM